MPNEPCVLELGELVVPSAERPSEAAVRRGRQGLRSGKSLLLVAVVPEGGYDPELHTRYKSAAHS